MSKTLLPGEEPPERSPSPDDSNAFADSQSEEESDEDEADGFEMMETAKVEPADEDSASDDEEDQDAPGSQDDAASTNSADLCSNDFKLVWDTGKLERWEECVTLSFLWDLSIRMEPHQGQVVCGKVCTLTPVKEFCRFAKNVSY
jgi:hypothetical protein